jgi:hypothetical protein
MGKSDARALDFYFCAERWTMNSSICRELLRVMRQSASRSVGDGEERLSERASLGEGSLAPNGKLSPLEDVTRTTSAAVSLQPQA